MSLNFHLCVLELPARWLILLGLWGSRAGLWWEHHLSRPPMRALLESAAYESLRSSLRFELYVKCPLIACLWPLSCKSFQSAFWWAACCVEIIIGCEFYSGCERYSSFFFTVFMILSFRVLVHDTACASCQKEENSKSFAGKFKFKLLWNENLSKNGACVEILDVAALNEGLFLYCSYFSAWLYPR